MKRNNYDRSVRQCRDRYCHYLDPSIKTDPKWNEDDDSLLLESVNQHGNKWKMMEQIFPGRTEVSIRNRYNLLIRKSQCKEKKRFINKRIMPNDFQFLTHNKNRNTKSKENITMNQFSLNNMNYESMNCIQKNEMESNHFDDDSFDLFNDTDDNFILDDILDT